MLPFGPDIVRLWKKWKCHHFFSDLGSAVLDSNLEMPTGHMDISAEQLMTWTVNNYISIDELLINCYREYQQSRWSSQDWGEDEEYSWKHCRLLIHEKNLRRASLYSTGYSWQGSTTWNTDKVLFAGPLCGAQEIANHLRNWVPPT